MKGTKLLLLTSLLLNISLLRAHDRVTEDNSIWSRGTIVGNKFPFLLPEKLQDEYGERTSNETVVIKYKLRHPMNPLRIFRKSPYLIDQIIRPTIFEETTSYKNYGYKFVTPNNKGHNLTSKIMRGKITHVSRWGLIGNKTCTMYLQTPVNTIPMNVYSESGCKFAEDIAESDSEVSVHFQKNYWKLWNKYINSALRMTVEN